MKGKCAVGGHSFAHPCSCWHHFPGAQTLFPGAFKQNVTKDNKKGQVWEGAGALLSKNAPVHYGNVN